MGGVAALPIRVSDMTLLSINGLDKSFAGARALGGASLAVRAGEVHALMGENGAGKSTLIKVLAGVVKPDAGTVAIDGTPVFIASPADALRLGLRFIHQELSVVPHLSVAENIFLGRDYPRRWGVMIDWDGLNRRASAVLAGLGVDHIPPERKMARLTVGDQMLVKIAAAVQDASIDGGAPARLYVIDEPTAALSAEESQRLFAVIRRLRAAGAGIIYVSHRLDEVMELADRLTVLRDGATVATRDIAGLQKLEVIELMIGRRFAEGYPPRLAPVSSEVALSVEGLSTAYLQDVTFEVRKGEILGLAGLEGAGQSEVIRAIVGADGGHQGAISLAGRPVRIEEPVSAWAKGLAFLPRERRREGLVSSASIAGNVSLPHLDDLVRFGLVLDRAAEARQAVDLGGKVKLKSKGPRQKVRELSGGNQQKVVFARAIAGEPQVLLLDEPTRGVDVGARYDIHALLRELTAEGKAVVLASSDLPELVYMADRILVFRDGKVATTVSTEGLDQAGLAALCFGTPTAPSA